MWILWSIFIGILEIGKRAERRGVLRYKVIGLGLEEDLYRLFDQGLSSKNILEELIKEGKIPLEIGLSETAVDYWRKKWRAQKEQEERNLLPNRVDRMIDFLEAKLTEDSEEKPASLDAQIRGVLAMGKLLELKLKMAGKEGSVAEGGENPSLGDLLSQIGEEDFPR